MYVVYVDYSHPGIVYLTGPLELRHREGLWAHFYVRAHSLLCECPGCYRRICAGPIEAMPEGKKPGYMYPIF